MVKLFLDVNVAFKKVLPHWAYSHSQVIHKVFPALQLSFRLPSDF